MHEHQRHCRQITFQVWWTDVGWKWCTATTKQLIERPPQTAWYACWALMRSVQKAVRLWFSRAIYWRRWARHAIAVDELMLNSGPEERAVISVNLSACFARQHSSSNHMHDGLHRQVTRRTGICTLSSSVMVVSQSCTSASPSRCSCCWT